MSVETVKKIINHAEKDKIIGKLINGESPKDITEYLKLKFPDPEQAHLRLSQGSLSEFRDKYLTQYDTLDQILQDENAKEIDKKVYKSLVECKEWRDYQLKEAEAEVDLKKKILETLLRTEARAEQVFDSIQQNPGKVNGKTDYVLVKYLELVGNLIDKADRIVNEKPDQVVQHNVSVQMIEQHSYAFQEAIRNALIKLDPDLASVVMDAITEELSKLQEPGKKEVKHKSAGDRLKEFDKKFPKLSEYEPLDDEDDILSSQNVKNKNVLDVEFEDEDKKKNKDGE